MSDTAETDMVVAADTGDSGFIRNLVQLARRLERERDEARRECNEARAIAKMAYTRLIGLGVSSHTQIQFMHDAINKWDKEQKEEA